MTIVPSVAVVILNVFPVVDDPVSSALASGWVDWSAPVKETAPASPQSCKPKPEKSTVRVLAPVVGATK
jgi:hypothetical protein